MPTALVCAFGLSLPCQSNDNDGLILPLFFLQPGVCQCEQQRRSTIQLAPYSIPLVIRPFQVFFFFRIDHTQTNYLSKQTNCLRTLTFLFLPVSAQPPVQEAVLMYAVRGGRGCLSTLDLHIVLHDDRLHLARIPRRARASA